MTDDDRKSEFDLTFSAVKVVTSPSDHYLEADWQTIAMAPLWVFELVAAADHNVDEKERAAFAAMLDRPPPGIFAAFVFAHVRRHRDTLVAARASDAREPLAAIADVETLLRNYPNPDEADEFRRALVTLATEVAGASGGVLGLGAKISQDEGAMLERLRAVLRVNA